MLESDADVRQGTAGTGVFSPGMMPSNKGMAQVYQSMKRSQVFDLASRGTISLQRQGSGKGNIMMMSSRVGGLSRQGSNRAPGGIGGI